MTTAKGGNLMKQKCSFILKASTALVLCFLMLFGTVTTSLAAVVDSADTGAEADVADEGAAVDVAESGSVTASNKVLFLKPGTWGNASGDIKYYVAAYNSSGRVGFSAVATTTTVGSDTYYIATCPAGCTNGYRWVRGTGPSGAHYNVGPWVGSEKNASYVGGWANWEEGSPDNSSTYNVFANGETIYVDATGNSYWSSYDVSVTNNWSGSWGGNNMTKIATGLYKYTQSSNWDCGGDGGLRFYRGGSSNKWNLSKTFDVGSAYFSGNNAMYMGSSAVYGDVGTQTTLSLTSISAPTLSATTTTPTYGDSNTVTAAGNTLNYSRGGSAKTTTLTDAVYNFYVDGSSTPAQSSTTKTYDASGLSAGTHTITCTISSALTGLTSSAGSVSITVATPTHTVSRSGSAPSNGTIKFSTDNSTWVDGPITVAEGDNYYVKATPSTGYKISSFTVGGSAVNGASGSTSAKTYTGTMGAADVTAAASFAIQTFNVKKTESGASGGTVKVGNTTIGTSNTSVNYGTNYTVTVTAPTGYNVSAVSGISGTTSGLNTGSVTITGVSITAAKTIAVTYASAGTCGFTLSKASTTLNIGATDTFTATPNSYHSSGTISATSSDTSVATVSKSSNTYTVTAVAPGTATITVSCTDTGNTPATFSVTVNAPTISVDNKTGLKIGETYTPAPTLTNPSSTGSGWTVVYSRTSGTYSTTNGSTITGDTYNSNATTFKASYQYNGVEKSSDTFTVTTADATISFNSTAQTINVGGTVTKTASGGNIGSGATGTISYSSGDSTIATVNGSGVVTGVKPGTTSITATYTVKIGGTIKATKTASYNVTVTEPTVAISSASTANVGAAVSLTATSSGATTTPTYTWSVTNDTGTATVDGSTLTAKTPGTVTVTVTATYNASYSKTATQTLTVNTPVVSLTGATVAVGDTKTLTPSVTNVTGTPTYTYSSSDTSKATVTNAGVVTGVAAGTATITVTAILGTWSDTGTATVTVEAPEVTVVDTDDLSVKYLTVGTNYSKALSNNFSGAYTVASSNTSVATVSESSGTLTVVPVAKGTATITVTAAKGGVGSNTPGYLKSKLEIAATGADVTGSLVGTGIDASMTFTVNVSEAEDYKLILLTANKDSNNWNTAYVYYQYKIGSNPTQTVSLTNMPKIAVNDDGNNVFAYRMPIEHYNNLTLIIFNENSTFGDPWRQTEDITTKSNGYYLTTAYNGDNKRTVGTWTHPVKIPQVSISDVTVAVGETATSTLTNVNNIDVGQTTWSIADTSLASVSDGTVTGVDAGSTTLTAKVWAAKPYTSWTTWTMNDTTLPLIGDSSTAAVSVTADDKTLNFSNKLSLNGSSFDAANPELAGTITATKKNTATTYSDGDSVPHGTDIVFSAVANSGYRLVGWKVGDTTYNTATHEIHISANTTVYALFEKIYTTTINTPSNGTVKVNNANFTGEDVVWNNAPTSITVTPDTGYMIDYANSTNLSKYYTVDTSATTGAVTITGKSDVASSDKTSPSAITVAFKKLSYTVTGSAQYDNDGTVYTTGTTGGTITIIDENGGNFEYGDEITITANAHRMSGDKHYHDDCDYMVEKIEVSTDGGTTWNTVETAPTAAAATHNTTTMENNTFIINNTTSSTYLFRASFKAVYYFNVYNSWQEVESGYEFVASPPRKIEVGEGNSKRTFTYAAAPTASDRGEDNASANNGEPTARHILATSGTYYEGNLIVAYAGEQIKLNYSGLASSDSIKGVFFNNERRYTCQGEGDDLYKLRVYNASGWDRSESDDGWDFDYMADTTLRAFDYYYEGAAATTIAAQQSGYVADIDQIDHTVEWTAKKNYLNIDIELGSKYRLIINGDDWSKIDVTGNYNDEGYYYYGEQVGGTGANSITVAVKSSTTSTRSFTGNYTIKKKVGDNFVDVTDITVSQPGGAGTSFAIGKTASPYDTMPAYDLYVDIEVQETYNMKLGNIVVADAAAHKTMITECDTNSTSATTCVGTITAIPKKGDTTGSDISDDGTYYTYNNNGTTNNAADYVYAYTDSYNNIYLNGGVNKGGSAVQEGYSITYTYTASNNTYGPNYSFVGWFEGSYDNNKFTVNYNKKLSGKPTFTYTPTKNTVIMAVATRDLYLGGNFDSTGNIDGSATWSSGRIKMNFDPTYVKPGDSTKKGRYFYDFENVKANSEYQFRCYDTVSGNDDGNLTVWKTWTGGDYADDNDDIFYGRHKYGSGNAGSHGAFVYKTNTNNWSLIDNTASDHDSNKNHQANGYGSPVSVYFYAYDGGISVNSTYQWSMAYVSEGAGIDVLDPDKTETTGKYNAPTATVNAKTVGNTGADDVEITTRTNYYGTNADGGRYEKVYDCKVKKKDGAITINACPHDSHVELQAFVVYNIETKASEAELGPFTTSGSGDSTIYTGNVTVPQNTKLYIVPVYKFTDDYIRSAGLETHMVYVRTDEIDKDDWGGLVAMYSWGTDTRYTSGVWPGQIMIPSDDGSSFYAPLTFTHNALAGITFSNYAKRWGGSGAGANFLATYKSKSVSDVDYSANNTHIYQTYDYREPISIIDNINNKDGSGTSIIYDTEDMDLTFALKSGDVNNAPAIDTAGSGATSRVTDWSTVGYLTDRSGKNRVDLNGNKVNNATETYHIVAYYTNSYASAGNYDFDEDYNGAYSINWKVYDVNNQEVLSGAYLSASYTDAVVNDEDVTSYIASKLLAADYPVAGKAVKIAYEKPGTWSEAIRYSGQWYADGVNTLIEGKARVGILSDGVYTPMDSNMIGENYAVVADSDLDSGKGENLVDEFSNTHYSKAVVKKSSATKGKVTFTATNSSDKFIGWYMQNEDGEFVPVNSNYKNTSITPSFNSDITYYAFYSAAATYTFTYPGRNSTRIYSMPGYDLDQDEMAAGGILDKTKRASDVSEKLAKISDITVFNKNTNFTIGTADNSSPYELKFTGTTTDTTYTTTVYAYNESGVLGSPVETVTGTWARKVDLGVSYIANKPSGHSDYKFAGWIKYGTGSSYSAGNSSTYPTILSTQANFGYSVSDNISIEPFFVATDAEVTALRGTGWQAGIDKVGVTQELTSSSTGRIYTDTLINIRNNEATGEKYEGDSGLLVIFQTGESTKDATYSAAFDTLAADTSTIQSFVQSMASGADNAGENFRSAKLGASRGVGDAYAYRIKTTSLSDLNRADLYMGCDYSQFTGAKFLVVSYTKDGGSYTYSPIKTGTFTPGQKFPAV